MAWYDPRTWGEDDDGDGGWLDSAWDFTQNVFTGGATGARDAQKEANRINIGEAQKNRDFQEKMSSSGYQRAMADMETAGLNKMLAFSKGPASTPSGAQATVAPVASKSSILAGQVKANIEQAIGMKNTQSATQLNNQQASTQSTQANLNTKNADLAVTNNEKAGYTAQALKAEAQIARNKLEVSNAGLKADKAAAANMPYIKMIGQGVQSAATGAGAFMGLKGLGSMFKNKGKGYNLGKMPLQWEELSSGQRQKILRRGK